MGLKNACSGPVAAYGSRPFPGLFSFFDCHEKDGTSPGEITSEPEKDLHFMVFMVN